MNQTIKSICLPLSVWPVIHKRLSKEYPSSVILLRNKMKEVLGFTVRTYRDWEPNMVHFNEYIVLDFYDTKKKTMFILKFSEILNKYNIDIS